MATQRKYSLLGRSARELFVALVTFGTITLLATLLWIRDEEPALEIHFNGRVDIYGNFDVPKNRAKLREVLQKWHLPVDLPENKGVVQHQQSFGVTEQRWSDVEEKVRGVLQEISMSGNRGNALAICDVTSLENDVSNNNSSIRCEVTDDVDLHVQLHSTSVTTHKHQNADTCVFPCTEREVRTFVLTDQARYEYCRHRTSNTTQQQHLHQAQKINVICDVMDRLCTHTNSIQMFQSLLHTKVASRTLVFPWTHFSNHGYSPHSGQLLGSIPEKFIAKTSRPQPRTIITAESLSQLLSKLSTRQQYGWVIQRYHGPPLLVHNRTRISVHVPVLITTTPSPSPSPSPSSSSSSSSSSSPYGSDTTSPCDDGDNSVIRATTMMRWYMYPDAIVYHRYGQERQYAKILNLSWSMDQLKSYITSTYNEDTSDTMTANIQAAISYTLLATQFYPASNKYQCDGCFQLVEFELIFNSSLYPMVMGVSDLTTKNILQQKYPDTLLRDALHLVTKNSPAITNDILGALGQVLGNTGVHGISCTEKHKFCLSRAHLQYLMDFRRETINRKSFIPLYPSNTAERYTQLIHDLVDHQHHRSHGDDLDTTHYASILDLHTVVTSVAHYFHTIQQSAVESYEDGVSVADDGIPDQAGEVQLLQNVLLPDAQQTQGAADECNNNHTAPASLSSLSLRATSDLYLHARPHLDPYVHLTPDLDPDVIDYYGTVEYEVYLVEVKATANACGHEVRMEHKYGPTSRGSFTLGLGLNTLPILLVHTGHSEPWVVTTVHVHIRRLEIQPPHQLHHILDEEERYHNSTSPASPTNIPHQLTSQHRRLTILSQQSRLPSYIVCSIQQSCSLPYNQNKECGLRETDFPSWSEYLQHSEELPACQKTEATTGSWIVGCLSCSNNTSCDWSRARWQPDTCTYTTVTRDQLQKCLAGRKLLFIGDSTNRGMMYELMEQVNGSLTQWDKTHDIKVYSQLQLHTPASRAYRPGGTHTTDATLPVEQQDASTAERSHSSTTVAFSYYPQFWLPAEERPVFDKALYKLIKSVPDLTNDEQTVLVVGGVHWLGKHHLHVLQTALHRESLTNVTVVIKGLGSGFHQPVEGQHHLSLSEQRKLYQQNQALSRECEQYGYLWLDTYHITMARYTDYLQGKCACHFHAVREVLPSFREFMSHSSGEEGGPVSDMSIRYHVEGPINKEYTNILYNKIC